MAAIQRLVRLKEPEKPKLTRELAIARIRRPFEVGFKILCGAVGVGFVAHIATAEVGDYLRMDRYRRACAAIEDGESLARGREIASEQGLVFEEDDYALWRTDESIYALKPDSAWPTRYGCRFVNRDARLFRTRVK